ncbi:MAG: hypothetical protein K6F09_00160 [Clostridiales bacterium]|nr:hypothetical protein [Clostridiales bacterium]
MLYNKNLSPALDDELFKNPTAEYRAAPFWSWNDKIEENECGRQISVFKEMGFGGFHIHPRTGLGDEYLGKEFMDHVRYCLDYAKERDMLTWLYDEDRYASGFGGGYVTSDEKYRARFLRFTNDENLSGDERQLLACYDVVLDDDGYLSSYRAINPSDDTNGGKWFAFLEKEEPSNWFNRATYVDSLNPDALKRFTEVTHEVYKKKVGDEFGESIPSIFTDEPQFTRMETLSKSACVNGAEAVMPWTDALSEKYFEKYGTSPLSFLPELFFEGGDGYPIVNRYRFYDFLSELFASSFADVVGEWCQKNNIYLTGHLMEEPTLTSQTRAVGEAMRSYRSFGIPGIDILCGNHEFTTAKQAQSASHQFGREGVLSELYGVTGWDCDFKEYKHQGDWQAALGITVRVPHLEWYSMRGEAKRDYPASIGFQSSWYECYSLIEDHFARVNTAMTRGKAVVKVGVIHPVETFWLHLGPDDKTEKTRKMLDDRFTGLTSLLLKSNIDFDFIAESLLPRLYDDNKPREVGAMKYDTVIVPGCETLRETTVRFLSEFKNAGGRLLFIGSAPSLVDALPSEEAKELYENSDKCAFSKYDIIDMLENDRTVGIYKENDILSGGYIYQLRKDNDCSWLFIAHTDHPDNADFDGGEEASIRIKGEYSPFLYETSDGSIKKLSAVYKKGYTEIKRRFYGYDSLLLKLVPGKSEDIKEEKQPERVFIKYADEPTSYSLGEQNVLVLDRARYKIDGEEYKEAEELLKLDNICRRRFGYDDRGSDTPQPWTNPNESPEHVLTLEFIIESEIEYLGAALSLEDAEKCRITFNGKDVPGKAEGYYIDPSIESVALPTIKKGKNVLEVSLPFGRYTNTENMFITGDFGVKLLGKYGIITEKPKNIFFGDLTTQGFPFYGGKITYHLKAEAEDGKIVLRAPRFRGAMMSVSCDGREAGDIAYPPYECVISGLENGTHDIALTLYLTRVNTFGPHHYSDDRDNCHSPGKWRSDKDRFSEQPVIRKTGVLQSPMFMK